MLSLRFLLVCSVLIKGYNALPKVTYVCDGLEAPAFHVIATFSSSTHTYKLMRTMEGNISNPDYTKYCYTKIKPEASQEVRLSVAKQHFQLCGVKLESGGKKGNLLVAIMGNIGDRIVQAKLGCDFENPSNTATVTTGLGITETCKINQFFCPGTKVCLDAKLRCSGGKACVNETTAKEEGCNKNKNGEYNVETYSVNGDTKWVEFKGFTYRLNNKDAVTTDINDPKSKSSIDQARSSYVRENYTSTCAYGDLSHFNTYFNGAEFRNRCYSYFTGLKALLRNKCVDLRTKSTEGERNKYLHGLLVVSSTPDCSFQKVSSAAKPSHSFIFVALCFFVGVHFRTK